MIQQHEGRQPKRGDLQGNDFLWVSGVWRALPPGRQWVPGYWGATSQGVQWISGYWADAQLTEVDYLPEPPESIEAGPNVDAPSADYTWLPGCWIWQQNRYTGIGIPLEMLPRIFDPFTQAPGALNCSEGGIGIGLALVAHLVRLHGGTVQVFSEGPGHGSRFVVRLPPLHSLDTEDYLAERPDYPPAESDSHCVVGMNAE